MIFIPFSIEKVIFAYWFCATSCTPTKSKLYFEFSSAPALWGSRDSSVGIATGYGLDDQGEWEFESQ
jgi:hypothetical protein